MLTKNSLKIARRGDKIYPGFLEDLEEVHEVYLQQLNTLFNSAAKNAANLEEVKNQLKILNTSLDQKTKSGFNEIMMDRADFGHGEDLDCSELRWELIKASQDIRREFSCGDLKNFAAFDESISVRFSKSALDLRQSLYGDLPDARQIKSFKEILPQGFVFTYNRALAALVLQYAQKLILTVPQKTSHNDLRVFMQKLKTLRLLAEIDQSDGNYIFTVSGPLSIGDFPQIYGANYRALMDMILNLKSWSLRAELVIYEKKGILDLSQEKHGHLFYAALPTLETVVDPSTQIFIDNFNEKVTQYEISQAKEWITLAPGVKIFPDYLICDKKTKEKFYLECFPPWGEGVLLRRLGEVEKIAKDKRAKRLPRFLIAVDQKLGKKSRVSVVLGTSEYFAENGFMFSDFPSAVRLKKILLT